MYSHVDSQQREIRLVTIKAGLRNDGIQCHLTHVSLGDLPNFEALSYVWGSPKNPVSILLDYQQFRVTQNLGLALQYLRSATEDRVIWIDAICINQNDLDERSAQVQLMRDIYRTARRVISWLGEEDTQGRAASASWLVSEAAQNNFSPDWISKSILEEDNDKYMRRCFAYLGLHLQGGTWDYWTRTWITQEIALAQDGILQCGDTVIHFDPLMQLCNAINDVFWRGKDLPLTVVEKWGLDSLKALINALGVFRGDHEISNPLALNTPLLHLLCKNHEKLATDPRDKVYGLLGLSDLASSLHPGVQIDYRRSVRDVYMGAVQAIVDTTSRLEVLCVSCPEIVDGHLKKIAGTRRADLPTWTADWSQWTGPLIQDDIMNKSLRGAAMDSPASVGFQLDEGIMCVTGFCVGTVSRYGVRNPTRNQIGSHGPEFFDEVYGIVASWHKILTEVPGYTRELDPLFFQTLELGANTRDIYIEDLSVPSTIDETIGGSNVEHRMFIRESVLEHIQMLCEEKVFFLIQSIAPPGPSTSLDKCLLTAVALSGMKEGDLVCVLLGCPLPVILRPLGSNRYAFVNPAYVHNLMNGEAMARLEDGDYELKSFKLQ